jgi:thiaminase/transcriptional activator TenA
MDLINELFIRNREYFDKCLNHSFIKELHNDTLDINKFKYYLIQDAYYLKTFMEIHELLIELSHDNKDYFKERALNLKKAELDIRTTLLEETNITNESFENTKVSKASFAYQQYLIDIAKTNDITKILISLLPCYWIYQYIGEYFAYDGTSNKLYDKYITMYKSDLYCDIVKQHQILCNDFFNESKLSIDEVHALFEKGCQFEVLFFDSVYLIND